MVKFVRKIQKKINKPRTKEEKKEFEKAKEAGFSGFKAVRAVREGKRAGRQKIETEKALMSLKEGIKPKDRTTLRDVSPKVKIPRRQRRRDIRFDDPVDSFSMDNIFKDADPVKRLKRL